MFNLHSIFIYLITGLSLTSISFAQQNSDLLSKMDSIAKPAKGKVGVSVLNMETGKSLDYYGDEPCVMQSVFKFPVALAILDKIDKGEFSLQHKIHIAPKDLVKDTWSPMRDSFPEGNVNLTFETLIKFMVSNSDNNACDILIHHLGGPKKLQKYLRKIGIDDIAVKYDEAGMSKKWNNQYKNWCSAKAMTELLEKFYTGKILSKANTDFLYQVMLETTTGKNRIVKLLPETTMVAHKTGSSETNAAGLTSGTNDVGIITLPNGQHLAVTIFITDSRAEYETIENTIAAIAKIIFDDFR